MDSKTYNVAEDIVYDENNKHNGDVEVADNKFDFVEGDITYLSRKDGFANYDTATAAPTNFELDGPFMETVHMIRPIMIMMTIRCLQQELTMV